MSYFRWLVLGLLTVSETLIVHWLALVVFGTGLGWRGLAAAVTAVVALNLGAMTLLWSQRRSPFGFVVMRLWMVSGIGAIFSGPLAIAAWVPFLVGVGVARGTGVAPGLIVSDAWVAAGAVAVSAGFGSVIWGFLIGQRKVRVERVDLPIRNLPAPLAGLRIAHITDLHIGPQLRAPQLAGLVEKVNALEPDLIAITGDMFDFDPAFVDEGCRELAQLRAPHGVFAVMGNHDVYTGLERVAEGLAEHTSIQLLRDTHASIAVGGAELYLAGIDDPGTGWTERDCEHPELERVAKEIPAEAPRVLLVHRPSYFRQAARLGFPIAIAGHTHGGQIALPRAHHHNVSRLIAHWTRGLFHSENGESLLYVNRGLGISGPPIRLNCPREIGLLRLVPRV